MPTYVYLCSACRKEVEYFQSMSEAPKRKCPTCKKQKLVRQIGAGAGILFKGSGFYQTDYRSDSYKKSESSDKPAAACTGEPKSCAESGGPCATSGASSTPAKSASDSTPAAKKSSKK